jgi:hypothetical protein
VLAPRPPLRGKLLQNLRSRFLIRLKLALALSSCARSEKIVLSVDKKKVKERKLETNQRLLKVKDPDTMDKQAFAESMGMDGRALAGMLTQLRNNPNMREELKKLGYADRQIPGWVAAYNEAEAVQVKPVKTVKAVKGRSRALMAASFLASLSPSADFLVGLSGNV